MEEKTLLLRPLSYRLTPGLDDPHGGECRSRGQEAQRVERECRADAPRLRPAASRGAAVQESDECAGEHRAGKHRQLSSALDDGVPGLQPLLAQQSGDDGGLGREEERIGKAEGQGEDVDHPELDHSGDRHRGKRSHQDKAAQVRCQHQHSRIEAIGQCAADEHEEGSGDGRRGEHRSDCESAPGESEHEPGQRDQVELVTDEGDGFAAPQEPEVAVGEDSPEAAPAVHLVASADRSHDALPRPLH